jgi:hypothetical protein
LGFLFRKLLILFGSTFSNYYNKKSTPMTNPNDNKSYREIRHDSYTDNNGNTHTDVTRTSETVNNTEDSQSYQSGYLQGRTSERNYQQESLAQRDNDNANRGLLIGILLTTLAALIGGALWYFNQREQAVDNTVAPTEVPVQTSPANIQTPQPQTTIIERTKEVPVPVERTKEVPVFIPVPQQKASPAPTPTTPNINITVPPQQPAAKQSPSTTQTTPTPSPTSNSSTSSQSRDSNTTSTIDSTTSPSDKSIATPSQENKIGVTPDSSSSTTENSTQDSSSQ